MSSGLPLDNNARRGPEGFLQRSWSPEPIPVFDKDELHDFGIMQERWLFAERMALSPSGRRLMLVSGSVTCDEMVRVYDVDETTFPDLAHPISEIIARGVHHGASHHGGSGAGSRSLDRPP